MLPLDGITVVALEQAVAAPLATRHLADLGARVIKVERPAVGDFARHYDTTVKGLSSHFVWLNRSKESLTLDLKHPEAREALLKLIQGADIFVQNLAPGAADRLGLGSSTLRERNPRLVTCSISGYGAGGSYQDQKAYDLLIQAETGAITLTGTEEAPAKIGISVADIAAGMYAFSGILTALFMRERTGEGQALEVSLFEALAEWMGAPAYYTGYGGSPPPRSGAGHATIAPYGPFATGDGKAIFMGIQNEREWAHFCEDLLQSPQLGTDPRFNSNAQRVKHRGELHRAIEEVFQRLPASEIVQRLEAAQIAHAKMRSVAEFLQHPQLKDRARFRQIASPAGPLWALLPPMNILGVESAMGPIPDVGEHTETILSQLGFSPAQIIQMRQKEAI